MDSKFTEKIKQWLDIPEDQRDYSEGALMLLKLSGNRIMYSNIMANIERRHSFVDYQLQKYYNFRVQNLTHEQVEKMADEAREIVERNIPLATKSDESRKGRREDHDSLPEEIQALFVENLNVLRRMRELHLKLRTIEDSDAVCRDSERYPFLKELISMDKKLHSNWEKYDNYVPVMTGDIEIVK